METALRRLEGVDEIVISIQKQMFAVTYVPGTSFQPQDLRDAVAEAGVSVVRFHLSARGKVQKDGTKQFFVSGRDRFLLVDPPKDLPVGRPLGVIGVVDDSGSPFQLRLDDFKPLEE